MRLVLALLIVTSCDHTTHEPPAARPPPPAPVAVPEPSAPAISATPPAPVPSPPMPHAVATPTAATDDLPHLRARLKPLLARANACMPRPDLLGADADPITFALDAFGDQLVACAQAITRRGGSAFMDPVSYACWNVNPNTGALTRRTDLARSYFRCQDGGCRPYDDSAVISYDGTEQLSFDDARHQLSITTRAGAPVRSFASPAELAGSEPMRGTLTYVGNTIFALTSASLTTTGSVLVLDDHGKELARATGELSVMDAGHVLVAGDALGATVFDLATHASRKVKLPAEFAAKAVRYHDALYAIDDSGKLAVLDPDTFAVRQTRSFVRCR